MSVSKYDKNGNIVNLNRSYDGSLIDKLTYSYKNEGKSNQLDMVDDQGVINSNVADYTEGTGSYIYNPNGNMKHDPAKGTDITYNYLNLPEVVKVSDDRKVFYHYDAAGNKLAKFVENDKTYTTTDYIANLVYTNGQKSFFSTEEGRAVPIESNGKTTWHYEYNLKDHLGNTRVTFKDTQLPGGAVEIVQVSSYYPFGMVMSQNNYYNTSSTNYQQNKYLYNGKELQDDDLGGVHLDWYDYGARFYDPSLGRWHVIDPMLQYDSPYTYCGNNPISFIDPTGM